MPDARIIVVDEYVSESLESFEGPPVCLTDKARRILTKLENYRRKQLEVPSPSPIQHLCGSKREGDTDTNALYPQRRPILFIGCSLGGIVLKQASHVASPSIVNGSDIYHIGRLSCRDRAVQIDRCLHQGRSLSRNTS